MELDVFYHSIKCQTVQERGLHIAKGARKMWTGSSTPDNSSWERSSMNALMLVQLWRKLLPDPEDVRFKALKAAIMKTAVFWFATPCSPVKIYQNSEVFAAFNIKYVGTVSILLLNCIAQPKDSHIKDDLQSFLSTEQQVWNSWPGVCYAMLRKLNKS